MKRSERMKVVVELAEREEHSAATACEQAKQAVLAAKNQLSELEAYYLEYQGKFTRQKTGLRSSDIRTQREFLSRLSDAKSAQFHQIAQLDRSYDELKAKWYTAMLKRQNLEKLIETYRREEASVENTKEQKLIDDWVSSNYKQ